MKVKKYILFEKAYYTDGTGNPIGIFGSKKAYRQWVKSSNAVYKTFNINIFYKYSKENEWYYDDNAQTLLIPMEVEYFE